MGAVERPVDVEVNERFPPGGILFGERQHAEASDRDPGVVDEDVDVASGGGHFLHCTAVGDVADRRLGRAAGGADLRSHPVGAVLEQVVDDDPRTVSGQYPGRFGTDVLSGAGDQRGTPTQLSHEILNPH